MNAHIPQSYEATAELQEIASVPMQMIRPGNGTPGIAVVQDALAGSYLATSPGNFFTRREFMNMMMKNKKFSYVPEPVHSDPVSGAEYNKGRYTGQQLVEQLLSPINLQMGNKMYDDTKADSDYVKIVEGKFLQGTLDKDVFNKSGKGIVHVTYNDYGPKEAVDLLDGLQNMMESYLIMKGFSVGISDLIADEATRKTMEDAIAARKKEIDELVLQVHTGLFTNNSGKSNQDEFEARAIGILNKAIAEAGKAGVKSLSNENRLMVMVRSGSKGDSTNVAQMIACLGQVAVEGRRIPYGFTDRTLPHYKMFDDGAEARGFVESSFVRGLSPQEFFFHAMGGREGLIDTAVKTADTGYTQRQLIKAMEDLMIQHDGTVRDGTGKILQFRYGEDGINSTKLEETSIPIKVFDPTTKKVMNRSIESVSEKEIEQIFGMEGVDFSSILLPGVERGDDKEELDMYVKAVKEDRRMYVEKMFNSERTGSIFSSLNLERVLLNVKTKFDLKPTDQTNLTPLMVLEGIRKIADRTQPYNKLWVASLRTHLAPHDIVVNQRFTKEAWETLVEMIVVKNWKSWATPGELVGIIAAQSIGEPATQMTLNSVDWDTEILIAKNGILQTPKIGEFIDTYYNSLKDTEEGQKRIQYLPNNQIYIDLKDGNNWQAISCDEDGCMKWTTLEAITRHPVVNDDGTNTILEVTLESGRKVKATKAKSFLTLQNGKVLGANGSDLRVGDALPVATNLSLDQVVSIETINVRSILPATEYLYGSEVEKALDAIESGEHNWFQKNQGVLFTVPYSRSDAFRDAFKNGKNSNTIVPGHVYTKHMKENVSQIPETFKLTEEFGFFVGAYLAEGMSNETQINITNNNTDYLNRIQKLMDTWNVGTHHVQEERSAKTTGISGTTSSLVIHSTILAKVFQTLFGRVSLEKRMPSWVLQAPHPFVKGLMDGYVSGDGTVDKRSGILHMTSVSKPLLTMIAALLARYGIFTTMTERMPINKQNFKTVHQAYTLTIPKKYALEFYSNFTLIVEEKQSILDTHFQEMESYNRTTKWDTTKDQVWDRIQSIREIQPMGEGWVYDLTVAETRNFTTLEMVGLKDTFHQAGVAAKSAMTRGVPRLKELLKVTKNPKATSLTVYLKPAFRENQDLVREVAQDLELTLLKDIILKAAIYYDPKDEETILSEDQDVINFFLETELRNGNGGCSNKGVSGNAPQEEKDSYSKWVLRFEFDREKMFNKNITMDDIYFVIQNAYNYYGGTDNNLRTIYTDYNSSKLIMRIRPKVGDAVNGDEIVAIKKFLMNLMNNTIIRGVYGINAVNWRKNKDRVEDVNGSYEKVDQYVLDTDGSNFVAVMNHPAVDGTKLYSTNVHDIYAQLGIEATRTVLYNEINGLFGKTDVNYRHLGLLCDTMTHGGRLMSIDRYGINKMDNGPLAKACFEETEKVLLKAALFGEMDPVTGVSANIMMGQPIRAGTAFTQILLDEQALPELMKNLSTFEEGEEEEDGPTQEELDAELYGTYDDKCNHIQNQMNLTLTGSGPTIDDEEDIEVVEVSRR